MAINFASEPRKLSRQRRYQLRHKEKGLCIECPAISVAYGFCAFHLERHQEGLRKTYRRKIARMKSHEMSSIEG